MRDGEKASSSSHSYSSSRPRMRDHGISQGRVAIGRLEFETEGQAATISLIASSSRLYPGLRLRHLTTDFTLTVLRLGLTTTTTLLLTDH